MLSIVMCLKHHVLPHGIWESRQSDAYWKAFSIIQALVTSTCERFPKTLALLYETRTQHWYLQWLWQLVLSISRVHKAPFLCRALLASCTASLMHGGTGCPYSLFTGKIATISATVFVRRQFCSNCYNSVVLAAWTSNISSGGDSGSHPGW